MNKQVWIARRVDDDWTAIVGVFASEEGARAAAEADAQRDQWPQPLVGSYRHTWDGGTLKTEWAVEAHDILTDWECHEVEEWEVQA